MKLPVAVVQYAAGADAKANEKTAVAMIEDAAGQGAKVVVLPEYAAGWAPSLSADLAQPAGGEWELAMAKVAKRCGVWVVAGSMRPTSPGRALNVALVWDPNGGEVASYEKIHLFDALGVVESDVLDAGAASPENFVVLEVDGVRLGLATCYDLRFPELFRNLVGHGIDAFVVIAAWASGEGKADQLDVLARARALENTSFLALASQNGHGRCGQSMLVSPWGVAGAKADASNDEIVLGEIDTDEVAKARAAIPSVAGRRVS